MKLALRMIQLRKMVGRSQESIAEELSVSRQAVAKWESGESLPDLENIISLARLYGVSIDSLLKDESDCMSGLSVQVPAANEIIAFLCRAKQATYAGSGHEIQASRKNSHDLQYQEGDIAYYDSYLGGELFAGEEGLWNRDVPFWAMNYVGRVLDPSFSGDFLKDALYKVPVDHPFRGPELYRDGDKTYCCRVQGTFDWFSGNEAIFHGTKRVYECLFHGGTVR